MSPHCDTLDGPVVTAARLSLSTGDVELALTCVHADGEQEIREAYALAMRAKTFGPDAEDVADCYFFENIVRVHRAGEGATYTGAKPAGLSEGPVIPLAAKAMLSGSVEEVHDFLAEQLHHELSRRLGRVTELSRDSGTSLPAAREHVEAMLDFEVFSHHTLLAITGRSGSHAGPDVPF